MDSIQFKKGVKAICESADLRVAIFAIGKSETVKSPGTKKEREAALLSIGKLTYRQILNLLEPTLESFLGTDDFEFVDMSYCFEGSSTHLYCTDQTSEAVNLPFLLAQQAGDKQFKLTSEHLPDAIVFKIFGPSGTFFLFRSLPNYCRLKNKLVIFSAAEIVPSGLVVDGKFDSIKFGKEIVITSVSGVDTFCSLDSYVTSTNEQTFKQIQTYDIPGFDSFKKKVGATKALARKLLSAKTSLVLTMSKDALIRGLKREKGYLNLLNDDRSGFGNFGASKYGLLIEALNDNYVHSLLSSAAYQAAMKKHRADLDNE